MKDDIKLYSYYRSSCSYRVRIALHLKNIPFKYIPIHLLKNGGEQNSEPYKKLNPEGTVPCLTHKNQTITQTMAILQYLEDICPRPALFPTPLKTQIISISEIINSSIQPLQNLKVLKYLKKNWQITESEKKKWSQFWIHEGLANVEKKIQENKQSPFAVGRSLTAVELFIIPQMYNAKRFNVNLNNFPRLLKLEQICQTLPAFQKAHPSAQPDSPQKKMNNKFLLGNRKFWPLCATQFFGAFNDNFFKNALVILITFQSLKLWGLSSEQLIAFCGGVFIFPFFLFSAIAGQIADKYEKSRLITYIKILECFVMILAGAGFLTKNLSLLLLALFLMGLQSTLFSPLKYSYMPRQISSDQLISANALLQSSTFLAILLGGVFGGLVIAIPHQGIFYTSLGVLGLSVIGLFFSLFVLKLSSLTPDLSFQYNPFTSTWNLIRYVLPKKHILYTLLGLAWFWFYGATFLALLPGYGKKILGGNEQVVTFLLTLFSIGIGLGCMVCKKISGRGLKLGLAPIGALGLSVFLFDLSLQAYFTKDNHKTVIHFMDFIKNIQNFRIIFDLTMTSFSGGLLFVPLMTFLQTISPKKHLSRIISAGNIFDAFFIASSALLLILLFNFGLKEPEIFLFLASANLIISFLIYKFTKKIISG